MEMGQKYGLHHTYWGFPQVQTEQTEARSRGIPWERDRGEATSMRRPRGRECDCGLIGEVMSTGVSQDSHE